MDDLTGFQRDLLYVITGADQPSGQDVKEEIEQYYESELNHGRLYPNLDTLVNKELVEKGEPTDERTTTPSVAQGRKQSRSDGNGKANTPRYERDHIRPLDTVTYSALSR